MEHGQSTETWLVLVQRDIRNEAIVGYADWFRESGLRMKVQRVET